MDDFIYLESDEEITTVIDKIKQTESESVGLVVPQNSSLIQSVVNLKILKKEAEELRKKIAIISQDKIGRNLANQIGLIVFDSVKSTTPIVETPRPEMPVSDVIELDFSKSKPELPIKGVKVFRYDENAKKIVNDSVPINAINYESIQSKIEQKFSPEPMKEVNYSKSQFNDIDSKRSKKLISWKPISIGVASLVLGLLVLYVIYAKANITIAIQSDPIEQNLEIILDNNINKFDSTRLAIPAELQEIELEETQKFTSTGKKDVGEKAKGTITVYNQYDSISHTYLANSKFTVSGKSFFADSNFVVPGATVVGGTVISGKINVLVTAENPGESYNISPGDFVLDGAPSKIFGQSDTAFSGGLTREITIITQDDINNGKDSLYKTIVGKNHQELVNRAKDVKYIESAIKDDIISSSTDKKVGDEAQDFNLTLKARTRTLFFQENDYKDAVLFALSNRVGSNKELVLTEEVITDKVETNLDAGLMKLSGLAKAKIATKIDKNIIKKQIAGKGLSKTTEIINQYSGTSVTKAEFVPNWLKKVPYFANKINLNLDYK